MKRFSSAVAATVVVLLFSSLLATQAGASGFLVARFGGEHGHPTTDNPTAIYYNPAGISLRAGTHLYIDGTFAWRSVTYERPASTIDHLLAAGDTGAGTPPEGVAANSGKASLFNYAAAPFIGITSDLGVPDLGVGLAFYAPFGGAATWDSASDFDKTAFPGAADGKQRWWAIDGTLRSLYLTAAGAYTFQAPMGPDSKLSVGLGVNLVMSEINTLRARTADGSDDLVVKSADGSTLKEGRSLVDASGMDLSIGAGIIWKPIKDLWIGLSYQSQPGFGEMTLDGKLTNLFGTLKPDTTKIDLVTALPDIFRVGTRWRPNDTMELRLFGEYVRWSVLEYHCLLQQDKSTRTCDNLKSDGSGPKPEDGVVQNVQRNWQDAFGLRGGGSYWLTPAVEIMVGAGYDSSAVPDESLDPALIDMNKMTASLGGRFTLLDDALALSATYTQVFYFERTVDPSAQIFSFSGQPNRPANDASAQPNAAGTYNQDVGVLNVGVEYSF